MSERTLLQGEEDSDSTTDVLVAASPSGDDDTLKRLVETDFLVEDVSIDGMCGVY